MVLMLTGCKPHAVVDEPSVTAVLAIPEEQVDFAVTKVTVDRMVDPSIDAVQVLREIDEMVARVRTRAGRDASQTRILESLRTELYVAGSWNDSRPFQYDFDDPMGEQLSNKLLSTYLKTRRGNCVSMPMLFIAIGQRVGLDVSLAEAPSHLFVKWRDEQGAEMNVETTSGAGVTSDGWYRSQMPMTDEAVKSGTYMRRLSKREVVEVALETLMEFKRESPEQAAEIATLIVRQHPDRLGAILHLHAAYGRIAQRDFQRRFTQPSDIPIGERARYVELRDASEGWLRKAEALGWRPRDDEQRAKYLESVDRAKKEAGQ